MALTIEGRNPVLEALRAGQKLSCLYVREGIKVDVKIAEIFRLAQKHTVLLKRLPQHNLDYVSQTHTNQGVVAVKSDTVVRSFVETLEFLEQQGKHPFVIYIREAQNESNVGSVIRSAEGAGANVVILPPKLEISAQMIRSSMGASEHLSIIHEGLFNAIKTAKEWAIKVVGIELSGTKYYFEEDLTGNMMLIVGGEDRSLSPEVLSKCDSVVKIPQLGMVNSLNMSVAASVVMFEKVKQDLTLKKK